jgi:predicted lipid-binding transport protein (Tim44 family)
VIGAMTFTDASGTRGDSPDVLVRVRYESNYTEVIKNGGEASYYAVEEWTLSRKRGVKSRTPDRARLFVCPSCGAPLDAVTAGTCAHCGKLASSGEFDWVVQRADLVSRTPRGPMLTGDTPETGTNEPTLIDPEASSRMEEILAADPGLNWQAFEGRVGLIFGDFQAAWSARDLARMRAYLSDRLFETQVFWTEAYKQQKLRNVTENARILGIELARVGRDRFFDAVTVRLWATSLDYTLADDSGRVVGGSRSRERRYTEYWTLIRSSARKGPARTERVCPNCGAPLDINMAGTCKYCKAKVTAGEFDWVLSRIEQDEVYAG